MVRERVLECFNFRLGCFSLKNKSASDTLIAPYHTHKYTHVGKKPIRRETLDLSVIKPSTSARISRMSSENRKQDLNLLPINN